MTFLYVTSAPIGFFQENVPSKSVKVWIHPTKMQDHVLFFLLVSTPWNWHNIAPEHRCLEYDRFFLGLAWPIFMGELLLLVSGGSKNEALTSIWGFPKNGGFPQQTHGFFPTKNGWRLGSTHHLRKPPILKRNPLGHSGDQKSFRMKAGQGSGLRDDTGGFRRRLHKYLGGWAGSQDGRKER